MGKMEGYKSYKSRKEWNPKIVVEYVPFPNERARQRTYDVWAECMLTVYRKKQKFAETQRNLETLAS